MPQPARSVELRLDAVEIEKGVALPDTPNVRICGKLEPADAPGLDEGTRALSLFVVNERTPGGFADDVVRAFAGVETSGAVAVLRMVIAERLDRPPPRLDLVWTGP